MAQRSYAQLASDLRKEATPATLRNVIDSLKSRPTLPWALASVVNDYPTTDFTNEREVSEFLFNLFEAFHLVIFVIEDLSKEEADALARQFMQPSGGGRRRRLSSKFDKCVKSVRKTVKARKGSNKESAAIAICTVSVLHPRGKTMKRYRKGRLTTQRR